MPAFDFDTANYIWSDCVVYLLEELVQHPPFVERLENMNRQYDLIRQRYSWREICVISNSGGCNEQEKEDEQEIKGYFNAVAIVVDEYGLNPEWAMELIHVGVGDPQGMILRIGGVEGDSEPRQFTITWEDESLPTKAAIKRHILRQFEEQWKQLANNVFLISMDFPFGIVRTVKGTSAGLWQAGGYGLPTK